MGEAGGPGTSTAWGNRTSTIVWPGILTGIDGATLHFRTSNPVNHVKLVVRRDDEAEAREIPREGRGRATQAHRPRHLRCRRRAFPQAVAKSLKAQEATLAIAESCTGGLAGELVSTESGASVFFRGSIVAYHNEVKTGVLGVKPETIAGFGAVSEPTAREMAEGAKRVCGSSVAVAITGIAGPEGGAADKPVGTVCFAVCGPGTTRARPSCSPAGASACAWPRRSTRWISRVATSIRARDERDRPQLRRRSAAWQAPEKIFAAAEELARELPTCVVVA